MFRMAAQGGFIFALYTCVLNAEWSTEAVASGS